MNLHIFHTVQLAPCLFPILIRVDRVPQGFRRLEGSGYGRFQLGLIRGHLIIGRRGYATRTVRSVCRELVFGCAVGPIGRVLTVVVVDIVGWSVIVVPTWQRDGFVVPAG